MSLLVERARRGDKNAFEQLYRENVGRIYALCLRMCGDPSRAEELTQDVFVQAWRKLSAFRGESAFSSWLHRIAVNQVYQAGRSEKRRLARVFTTAEPETLDGPNHMADPGVRLDLERAIRKLPQGARTAFVLHDVQGYTHGEIGHLMGIAEGTVKAQLHRARKLLRKALEA